MKIFIVMNCEEYEGGNAVAVFSKKKKAQKYIESKSDFISWIDKEKTITKSCGVDYYSITELTLYNSKIEKE